MRFPYLEARAPLCLYLWGSPNFRSAHRGVGESIDVGGRGDGPGVEILPICFEHFLSLGPVVSRI